MDRRDALKLLMAAGALVGPAARATTGADPAASVTPSNAAAAPAAPADPKDDLRIVRAALALHPGLHRYLTPAEAARNLDLLEREFLAASTLDARYLALSRFLATIRCGHSYANFFNQKRAVAAALFDRPTRLPFEFRWLRERMVVTNARAGVNLPPGTVVETVNGVRADRLLAALMPYTRADGHNDGKRRSLLSVEGTESIEYFDVFQGLLFAPAGTVHRLEVVRPGGRRERVEVPAITLAERRASREQQPQDGRPEWTLTDRPDGVSVLTMPGWAMYNSPWKTWQAWLDERLDSLPGRRALVIDIRANEGGDDCGDRILERLASRDLTFDGGEQRVRFRRTPADLDPYLDTWDDSFRTLGVGGDDLGGGWYRRPAREDNGYAVLRARAPRVTVPVAALVGPRNSSATFQFAHRAQQAGLVRLFGQQTGGNRRGINGGCFFFVRLPASGLEFDLPLVGYFPSTPQPDAGAVPDVVIEETPEDIARGRDRVMEAALAWATRA
jgi:hypothetical protein